YLDGLAVDAARAGDRLRAGQRVGLWMDRPGSAAPADRRVADLRRLLAVVHEDEALVVVDKPAGLLVEPRPGRAGEEVTVLDMVRDHVRHDTPARAYVVHRIDRNTSGLVLFARTLAARDALKEQFEAHTPQRVYQAVLLGTPEPASGVWHDRLSWDSRALRQHRAHGRQAGGKDARARYRVLEQFAAAALVEVSLVTGRRNQIRVQAGLRGYPLLGEHQYRLEGPAEPAGLPTIGRQALHACRLGFTHPATGRKVTFRAPLPGDLAELLAALRAGPAPAVAPGGRRGAGGQQPAGGPRLRSARSAPTGERRG
ncbi:MAG: RluA family pseudouridine synthase, partial [Candidatus Latescibacterota bacterium]